MAMAKIHRFFAKNSTPFAPNVIIFAAKFKRAPNNGATFFQRGRAPLQIYQLLWHPFLRRF